MCVCVSTDNVDKSALQVLFNDYDTDRDGFITANQLEQMLVKLGVAPLVDPQKRPNASVDNRTSPEPNQA